MSNDKVVKKNASLYWETYKGENLAREGGQPIDVGEVAVNEHFNKEKIEKAEERRRNIVKEADRDEPKKEEKEIDR